MHRLTGRAQHYAWGSYTSLPQILGIEPTDQPFAEYWLGAHVSAPAVVTGEPLDSFITNHPEVLGKQSRQEYGDRLPYLLKLLAAEQPLSLQAHPTRHQAEEGFQRENSLGIPLDARNRTYRDDWPKPEALVALTGFDGLCGFRDPHETVELFDALQVPLDLDPLLGPLTERAGAPGMQEVFLEVLSLVEQRRGYCDHILAAAINHVTDAGPVGEFARTAVELDAFFPSDPGIIGALMLNRFHLEPGQGMFLAAGVMHAYLKGTCVEIMANSDNVLRGGLTGKHIDVDELVRVVDFTPTPTSLLPTIEVSPGVHRYLTPAPEFALWRIQTETVALLPNGGARILIVIDGDGVLRHRDAQLRLRSGEAAFISDLDQEIELAGTVTAFLAAPGVSAVAVAA